MNWIQFNQPEQLQEIVDLSHQRPCLIFKHSTSCSISSMAKYRLEQQWDFSDDKLPAYYLDLLSHRAISNQIAETLHVHHESPQLIVLHKGEVILDSSHLDISVGEIKEVLEFQNA